MKKLFIYYSLSGNGDYVANYLSKNGIDNRKVKTLKEMPKSFFLRILKGGFLAGINYKAKLKDFDNSIDEYDEIIIGSPIWNGKISCPINTVLDSLDLSGKILSFILYSGSGKAPKTSNMLNEKYNNVKIINLIEPKKNEESMKKELEKI